MNKKIKIIIFCFAMLIGIMLGQTKVEAATASISANKTTVTEGDSIKVTLKYTAAAWDLHVSSELPTNSTADFASATDDAKNATSTKIITYNANKKGTYSINLSGTVSDENDSTESSGKTINQSISVTVKAKSSSGNSSSGNSNSGSSENTKPSAPSFTSVNETVYATDSLNVRSSPSTSGSIIGSLSEGDSATRTGIGDGWSKVVLNNGTKGYVSSSYLDTTKPKTTENDKKEDEEEKSNTKNLKSLTVENYKLEPEFDPEVTEYNLTVGTDVEKLEVSAIPQDENSKVEITGNTDLLLGENTINIKVTAEDETVKIYKINVSKIEEVSLQLSKLEIENYTLTPEFSQDIYEYTLNIGDTSITSLNVIASSNTQNAVIEIAGNNELKPGKNIITVLVKDEENTTVYQIVVNISEEYNVVAKTGMNDNDLYMYTGIAAGILILIMIIIAIVKKRKKDNEEEFAPLNTYDLDLSMKDDNKKDKKNEDKTEKLEDDENSKEKVEIGVSNSDELTDEKTRKKGKHF